MSIAGFLEEVERADEVALDMTGEVLHGRPVETVVDDHIGSFEKRGAGLGFVVGADNEAGDEILDMVTAAGLPNKGDDLVPLLDGPTNESGSDEARGSCDGYLHVGILRPS